MLLYNSAIIKLMRNYWGCALGLSVAFHTVLFLGLPPFHSQSTPAGPKEKTKEIEMSPEKIEKIPRSETNDYHDIQPLPYVENIMNKLITAPASPSLKKPDLSKEIIKEIAFSELGQEDDKLKENPAYMAYYRAIREKIRANMYQNYKSNKRGEVSLSFRVLPDGSLQGVFFNPQSAGADILKNIALKSLKESAPFPEFPAEFKERSDLRFNISVYFKNN